MTRRFQFSLARSLIAVGLLCVAAGLSHHLYTWNSISPVAALLQFVGIGMALATSVGIIFKRTGWMALGAFLASVPIIVMDLWIWDAGHWK